MFVYFLKRFSLMIFTFFVTTFLFFLFINLLPTNIKAQAVLGNDNTVWVENYIKQFGLDKPIPIRFFLWIKNAFQGDFGWSTATAEPAARAFFYRIPASIKINLIPYFLSVPIAIILGVVAAIHKNKAVDQVISVGVMLFISIPYFVVALLAQYIFHYQLHLVPLHVSNNPGTVGWNVVILSYILPVAVLTISGVPGLTRSLRAELTEQMTGDYLLLAMSKGLTRRQATMRHALKNALVPFLPGIFIGIIGVMNGGIITENIFGVKGTGNLYLLAFNKQDYNLLMLITAFGQFIGLLSAIVGDISYTLIDPRIRVGGAKV